MAEQNQIPIFTASSLRFSPSTQSVASGEKIGRVLGADTFSPAWLEETHSDLFWYGIHGIEALFTVMGTGCQQVRRILRDQSEVVTGEWDDGRVGTFRGLRSEKTGYGGMAYGEKGIAPVGAYEGYEPLVEEILSFFRTGKAPVSPAETIEIYAFMEAAQLSSKRGGQVVSMAEIMSN